MNLSAAAAAAVVVAAVTFGGAAGVELGAGGGGLSGICASHTKMTKAHTHTHTFLPPENDSVALILVLILSHTLALVRTRVSAISPSIAVLALMLKCTDGSDGTGACIRFLASAVAIRSYEGVEQAEGGEGGGRMTEDWREIGAAKRVEG